VAIGGDGEKAVLLHDLERGGSTRLEPASSYYYVTAAFSPDGKMLAAGDLAGPIRVWDVASHRLLVTLSGHPEESSAVAFSPDGRTLASLGNHQGLKLWHVPTWSEVHSVDMDQAGFNLVFSPDGSKLAVTLGTLRNERVEWLPAPREDSGAK
jgi:WD40 repeat protein